MIKLFLTLVITVIFFIIIQRKGEGKSNKEIIGLSARPLVLTYYPIGQKAVNAAFFPTR